MSLERDQERLNNLSESSERGEKAAEVLENSEFTLSFGTMMDEITRELESVDTSDERKMISVVTRYQEATKFKNRLIARMQQGNEDRGILTKLLNRIKGN